MSPDNRLFQSQEIFISKLSKYLHLVNVQFISIQDEDIDKLTFLTRAGNTMTDEIIKIEKVVRGIYRDLESAGLLTDTVKKKYNENRKASDELIKQIEEKSFSNRKCLASLRGNYRNRIDNIMKSVSPELRILHSASFPDQSDMLDIEV